jgi:hypothetical protein
MNAGMPDSAQPDHRPGGAPDEAPGGGVTTGKADPSGFDHSVAHQSRVYDYLLGGKDHYAADRAATEAWLKIDPELAFTRDSDQVLRFFDGTDLVPPGLVRVEQWRPDPGTGETRKSSLWCAAGRKRSEQAEGLKARGRG